MCYKKCFHLGYLIWWYLSWPSEIAILQFSLILDTNLTASRLHGILQQDVLSDIEKGPWFLVSSGHQQSWSEIQSIGSAVQRRSPGRKMRPINVTGNPCLYLEWSVLRLINFRQIFRSLTTVCSLVKILQSFWNLTGSLAPLVADRLSNFKTIG